MRHPAATLVEILDDESDLYEELLGLLRQEEAALVGGSGHFTAQSLARKEALVLEIRLAELSRQATVRRLTGRGDTRLRDLPGADAGDLGGARGRLTAVLTRVAETAHRVDILLARSLARLHHTLDLLREAVGAGPHYTAGAELVRAALPTLDGRV